MRPGPTRSGGGASSGAGGASDALGAVDTSDTAAIAVLLQTLRQCARDLPDIDLPRIIAAARQRGELDGVDLESAAIEAAVALTAEDPAYSSFAARLLQTRIEREVGAQGVDSFATALRAAGDAGLVNERLLAFAVPRAAVLEAAIDTARIAPLDHRALALLRDRYLLRDPRNGALLETPIQLWLRVAAAFATTTQEAVDYFHLFASLAYLPSDETLLHAGTRRERLSSCYLVDSQPRNSDASDPDALDGRAGDVGFTWHGTLATEPLPAALPGSSACVFVETWHVDIERFLDGAALDEDSGRVQVAHWIPDLFMRRVEDDGEWSLFAPGDVPELADRFGPAFEAAYAAAEEKGLARRQLRARDLYARMIETIATTGRGWFEFKDKANLASNQTATPGNTVHGSNVGADILEVTSEADAAVCNVGAINLARHLRDGAFDFDRFAATVRLALRQLDRAIDLDAMPAPARRSSRRWRALGLGVMGLQDVFFELGLPFDGFDARQLSTQIFEALYFHALDASSELAQRLGAHEAYADTRAARGELQFDSWGVAPSDRHDWTALRARIAAHGLRNSLLIAIGPTTTIAALAGCSDGIAPQLTNFIGRPTDSGDVLEVNPHLVARLKELGLWSDATRAAIRLAGGSIQGLYQLPEGLRTLHRTAWELSTLALVDLAADRGAFVDQSQSLDLFVSTPDVAQLGRLYLYAWRCGLKTTHSLRSRWPGAHALGRGRH
jgi:ribonucleoside-diphosphate reductase alpha chain